MEPPSLVIGIAGGTGAGKTTVAREIADAVDAAVTRIPVDNYYENLDHLAFEERTAVNYDHPSAFEWELLRSQLADLLAGEPIRMPQYDFAAHLREDERVTVEPTAVVVVEGILALYDEPLVSEYDLRIYVEADADVRILRRIRRDVVERGRDLEGVIDQYLSTVKPMHERFVEPTKKRADVIIPEGSNRVAVDLLRRKVASEIREVVWDEPPAERSRDTGPDDHRRNPGPEAPD